MILIILSKYIEEAYRKKNLWTLLKGMRILQKINLNFNKSNKKIHFLLILLLILMLLFITNYKKRNDNNPKRNDKEKYINKIPVFTFHKLVPNDVKKKKFSNNIYVLSIDIFEEMMKYLYDNGYKTISTRELYKWHIGEVDFKIKTVLITIDDGSYEDYYLAYPILRKYNLKATSFVIGSHIKNITPPYYKYNSSSIGIDAIKKVRKEYPNFEFQSHSFNMHYSVLDNITKKYYHKIRTMTYEQLKNDTIENKKYGFNSMAFPYGEYREAMKEILKNQGYLLSFLFGKPKYATRNDSRFKIPRIEIKGTCNLSTFKKWLNY